MTGRGSGEGSPSVLWLFGPPGVGKTTVGWSLYRAWSAEGTPTAYVDIDQLGMLYPTPDPRNHRVKAQNLAVVFRSFLAAGMRRLIVSGVVDPDEMADFARAGAGAGWVWCRLTASTDDVRDRLVRHRDQPDMIDDAVAHARLLEDHEVAGHALADISVDTTGRSVDEVVASVRAAVESRPPDLPSRIIPAGRSDENAADLAGAAMPGGRPLTAIAVTGPRAVGKSTVAWEVFQRVQREGHVSAFVDLEQVGFLSVGVPSARARAVGDVGDARDAREVRAANAGAMARVFAGSGATVLVLSGAIVGPEEQAAYSAALAPAELTVARLEAGEASVRERVAHRAVQRTLHLPGDDLRGLSAEAKHEVVERSMREAADLVAAGVGHPVGTDGRFVERIAEDVLALRRGA
ncbi:hypothetical protein [Planctomonas deserti]|uniref:hypothetical protein n=1 Tax=Planctomonas deserti TaxID=2144185 RepID=UPI000D368D75|nr:hypothetical protein [Planctomonas deserti]